VGAVDQILFGIFPKMAHLHGGMSGIVAFAAVEALNGSFQWHGWTSRLDDNLDRSVDEHGTVIKQAGLG
jgi:hypothetical protein